MKRKLKDLIASTISCSKCGATLGRECLRVAWDKTGKTPVWVWSYFCMPCRKDHFTEVKG
jgi:hypothetical protein